MSEFRSVDGELKLLERTGEFIFPVELWMVNDSVNRNNWQFVNLEQHRAMWAGVPILVAYTNGGRTVGSGHNQTTRRDELGNEYQSFTDATAERIVGAISENPDDIRLAERDGYTWVVGKGFLWAWYARELVDKITRDAEQGRTMSVSIEALVTKESIGENGVAVEEEYQPLGVTVLGDKVDPAVVDAHIAMLSEMQDEFKELKLRAASYMEQPESANSEDTKPQNNSQEKGLKKHMRLSKQQIKTLQSKFGEFKYTVLAAEQYDDNSIVVCLMGDCGNTAIYTMASADATVYAENIVPVYTQVHFCSEGHDDICVDSSDMTESAANGARECSARAEAAENELKECKATIEKMVNAENARRLSVAKAKVTETLDAFNRNRDNKVSEKVLETLKSDVEAGKFTACADESGVWNGDKAVEKEVLSLCATAVMEMDKSAAAARAAADKNTFVWNRLANNGADDGSVEALLARKGITG